MTFSKLSICHRFLFAASLPSPHFNFIRGTMRKLFWFILLTAAATPLATHAQICLDPAQGDQLTALTRTHDYVQHRTSSYDRTGGNDDARHIDPGATLTLLDEPGPSVLTHIWFTTSSPDERHLKQLVPRNSSCLTRSRPAFWSRKHHPVTNLTLGFHPRKSLLTVERP
jgi:hypothetical protein